MPGASTLVPRSHLSDWPAQLLRFLESAAAPPGVRGRDPSQENASLGSLALLRREFIFHYQKRVILVIESVPALEEPSLIPVHGAAVYLGNLRSTYNREIKYILKIFVKKSLFLKPYSFLKCLRAKWRTRILSCLRVSGGLAFVPLTGGR